ncbi:MAG: SDR family oxidoreductase [Deltaproteobacteria bacterium]|jgi:thioester reductase-like protein|nr:SDR family oxidoreductase [Deltaproteobacteria bacterium]MBW2536294.1 SDR family oxidoreductase [Deltaproteobacteria bacterium]
MPRDGYDQVVLLTGFPALQARKLLWHLLDSEPRTLVHAIVLEDLMAQAERCLADRPADQRARVKLRAGDAAAMDMGLGGREYLDLAAELDRIHHVAHVNYVGVDPRAAEYANVRGAVEAVEIGRNAPHLSCLIHHSTASVAGDRRGVVHESELDEGQRFHSIIQETRMKGEKVMRRAMDELPIAVVRPTTMVGDSGTGEADHFDGPYLLVMLILGLPKDMAVPLPRPADTPLNIVPVDFVVRAAHYIGRHPDAPGRTFHLASCEQLTAEQLFELVAQAGGRRTAKGYNIPTQVARALLSTPGVDKLLHKPLEFVQQLASPVEYDTRNADRMLRDAQIECPPLPSYVDTLVARVQEHLQRKRQEFEAALEDDVDDPLF